MSTQKHIDLVLAYESAIHRMGPTGRALSPLPEDERLALRVLQVEAAREALKNGEFIRDLSQKNAATYTTLIRRANLRDEDLAILRDQDIAARVASVPKNRPTAMQIRAAASFRPLYEFDA